MEALALSGGFGDEWPTAAGWAGIMLISMGVYLASGGPLDLAGQPSCSVHGFTGKTGSR